ncbi:M15 family metallopeptidase [uncultured Rothia sp.]|uniref:M15 family metallopeptidase n=1 Tax=uncultured Rothia sp. TaxID=316088 RepID=UPI0025EE5BF6|nr:M15 family metallopeptidase [uncultured Rothia sp.]
MESSPESLRCLVNKMRPFAQKDWAPSDLVDFEGQQLRAEAAQAARTMMDAAKAEGVTLTVSSAYRSYAVQQQTYQHWVSVNGQKVADQLSARPGYSEHQTGLAIDFSSPEGCRLEECYEDTRAGRWLAKNAQNYGFILRFPKGQQAVTGYLFEPWHYRYLGKDLTARYVASGANTLEEFLGTGAAPDYAS